MNESSEWRVPDPGMSELELFADFGDTLFREDPYFAKVAIEGLLPHLPGNTPDDLDN